MPSRKAVEVYGANVIQRHAHSPQPSYSISPLNAAEKRMGYVCPILGTTNAVLIGNRP